MAFEHVYTCNEHQIDGLYKTMAENFFDDDLYCTVFPDSKARKKILGYFFKRYIQTIRPYIHVIADSEELNCVMVVYDSSMEVAWKYHVRLLLLNLKMIPGLLQLHSWNSIVHVIKCWDMFTSRWVKEFVVNENYHVDLLYTKQEMRGKGLASHLLDAVCTKAKQQGYDVTMETHHKDNLRMYEHAGFKLMSVITHPGVTLKQYCLLIRNSEV